MEVLRVPGGAPSTVAEGSAVTIGAYGLDQLTKFLITANLDIGAWRNHWLMFRRADLVGRR